MNEFDLTEYGIRCLIQISAGEKTSPVTVAKLSENEGISISLVRKMTNTLKRKGLIQYEKGGFKLSNKIKLEEAVSLLRGPLYPISPISQSPQSTDEDNIVWRSGTF